jgi:hypothetical protein
MGLHQALEEPVTEDQKVLAAVECFTKAQQCYPIVK